MQTKIEQLFEAQARIRADYHRGNIDAAIATFHVMIEPYVYAVDPRVSRCARRLSESLIRMVDDDPVVIAYLKATL
jgi:hypothetical protein